MKTKSNPSVHGKIRNLARCGFDGPGETGTFHEPFQNERVRYFILKGLTDFVLFELTVEGGEGNVQQACGLGFVSLGVVEHFLYMESFRTRQVEC